MFQKSVKKSALKSAQKSSYPFKSTQNSAQKSSFPQKSAQKSTLKSTFGSSDSICRWDSENIHVKILVSETFVKITYKVIILETISSGHPALIHVTQ